MVSEESRAQAFRAIGLAAQLENEGMDLYLSAAELVADPMAKQMFQKLAEDERQHLAVIKKMQDDLVATLDVSRYDLAEALGAEGFDALPLSPVFDHLKDLLARSGELRSCSELDAIAAALVAELNSVRYYRDLLLASDSEEARDTYRRLIAEEKKHFEILTRRTEQVLRAY